MKFCGEFPFIWLPILCSVLVAASPSIMIKDNKSENKTVWTGENITLICEKQRRDINENVSWEKRPAGADEFVKIKDERFTFHENSNELRIRNITMADAGSYMCVIFRQDTYAYMYDLRVKVKELFCEIPKFPSNGEYKRVNETKSDDFRYRVGDKIRYFCHKEYFLEGAEERTCVDPKRGWTSWTGDTPSCEKMASSGVQDGRLVSEFSWFLANISEKVKRYRNQNGSTFTEGESFYTGIPGYKMRLEFTPDYNETGVMAFQFRLLPGKFDSLLAWPFPLKHSWGFWNQDKIWKNIDVEPSTSKCVRSFTRPSRNENPDGCRLRWLRADKVSWNREKLLECENSRYCRDGCRTE